MTQTRVLGILLVLSGMIAMNTANAEDAAEQGTNRKIEFKEGYPHIDGRKRFPIGLYVALAPSSLTTKPDELKGQLDGIAEAPFNFLINYASEGGSEAEVRAFHEELAKRGLSEFFALKDFYKNIGTASWQIEFPETEEEAIRSRVRKYKDLPALAGWYLVDELPQNPPLVEQHKRWAKDEDPAHPTLSVISQVQYELRRWVPTCDILALDYYPVDQSWVSDVGAVMRHFVKETEAKHPSWFVVQAHGGYVYNDEVRGDKPTKLPPSSLLVPYGRAPTPQEMRAMTYLALVNGATGIGFYYHRDILLAYDTEVRWPAVKEIARNVDEIADILLAPDLPADEITGDNPNIEWRAKDVNGTIHLIAVNSGRDLQTVTLRLPRKFDTAKTLQGTGTAYVYENEMLLVLDSLDAIVVRLE